MKGKDTVFKIHLTVYGIVKRFYLKQRRTLNNEFCAHDCCLNVSSSRCIVKAQTVAHRILTSALNL